MAQVRRARAASLEVLCLMGVRIRVRGGQRGAAGQGTGRAAVGRGAGSGVRRVVLGGAGGAGVGCGARGATGGAAADSRAGGLAWKLATSPFRSTTQAALRNLRVMAYTIGRQRP